MPFRKLKRFHSCFSYQGMLLKPYPANNYIKARLQEPGFHLHICTFFNYHINSTTIALAPPPPLQIPAAPYLAPFCFNTFNSVTIILAPLAPNG